MLTVIKTGGKQYTVKLGDIAKVEKLPGKAGDTLSFESFFLMQDGVFLSEKNSVTAEIIAQTKSKKLLVFKKKRRKNYRRIQGHRQHQTILKIIAIKNESQVTSDHHVATNQQTQTCSLEENLPKTKSNIPEKLSQNKVEVKNHGT